MVHNEIHTIDLLIIAAYLIAMVLIGLVVVRKVRNMDDYYLGGRSFGPLVLMATVCATIIGGSGLMGRAGVAYSSGFKAIMTALPYLLGMFIFSGFAGRISAVGTTFGVSSIPDLFEQRFGKSAKVALGALIAFTMMGTVASQVTATATIINMLGNEIGISYEMGAIIACCVFIIYTATSGLFGVIYTDVFQFVMLILFVYILIPASSLAKLGGMGVFLQNLAPELSTPYLDGGIADSIPIAKARQLGCTKSVVILTRPEEYRKGPNELMPLIRARYWRYPRLVEAMATRHLRYNATLDELAKLEKDGSVFVIRPARDLGLGRTEKNLEKLTSAYRAGYAQAQRLYPALKAFLAQN